MKVILVVLVSIAVASCKPASDNDIIGTVVGAVKKCGDEDVSLCLKERALRYFENMASSREYNFIDGVSLIGNGSPRSARSLEPLSEEPRARESQIENRILDTFTDFLENHVIQLRMPKAAVDDVKRSLEEGRGKKKKLQQLLPIYGLLQLKIQSLIPLFLAIIAFAAVKGLFLAKAALVASALVLLKKLLSKDHHESYEVVAHPHHEEHYSHGHGGWGRSSQDAQNLAYNAYAN